MSVSTLMMMVALMGPVGLPSSKLARKNPPRPKPKPHGWEGDGVKPEGETRQQRRARERKETEQ